MCTGIELLMLAGATVAVTQAISSSGKKPPVVQSSPVKDQAKIEAEAQAKAMQEQTARKRRQRGASLLASGGGGDESPIQTAGAGAKASLGA